MNKNIPEWKWIGNWKLMWTFKEVERWANMLRSEQCAVQRSDSTAKSINTSSTFYHFNQSSQLKRLSSICITFHLYYYRTYRHVCCTRILLPRWKWELPSINLCPCRWVRSFCRNLVDFAQLAWICQTATLLLFYSYHSVATSWWFCMTEWCRWSVNTNEYTGHFSDIFRHKCIWLNFAIITSTLGSCITLPTGLQVYLSSTTNTNGKAIILLPDIYGWDGGQ